MIAQITPWLDYPASLLLALVLMTIKDLKYRWPNAGSFNFSLHGIFIGAIPVILTHSMLLAINMVFLKRFITVK